MPGMKAVGVSFISFLSVLCGIRFSILFYFSVFVSFIL